MPGLGSAHGAAELSVSCECGTLFLPSQRRYVGYDTPRTGGLAGEQTRAGRLDMQSTSKRRSGTGSIGTRLCGAMTAMVTPFRDGEIDWPAVEALIERQIGGGTD